MKTFILICFYCLFQTVCIAQSENCFNAFKSKSPFLWTPDEMVYEYNIESCALKGPFKSCSEYNFTSSNGNSVKQQMRANDYNFEYYDEFDSLGLKVIEYKSNQSNNLSNVYRFSFDYESKTMNVYECYALDTSRTIWSYCFQLDSLNRVIKRTDNKLINQYVTTYTYLPQGVPLEDYSTNKNPIRFTSELVEQYKVIRKWHDEYGIRQNTITLCYDSTGLLIKYHSSRENSEHVFEYDKGILKEYYYYKDKRLVSQRTYNAKGQKVMTQGWNNQGKLNSSKSSEYNKHGELIRVSGELEKRWQSIKYKYDKYDNWNYKEIVETNRYGTSTYIYTRIISYF